MTWDKKWSHEEWQRWKAEREAARNAATVPEGAAGADDHWTLEQWRTWEEEQEDILLAAAVSAETANWNGWWAPEDWQAWRAAQEAPPIAGAALDEFTAAASPAALPVTPENTTTVPEMLLSILAATWEGPLGFGAGDWPAVGICLEQHGISLLPQAPARDVRVSWEDREFWKLACWWCGRITDPVHNKSECEGHKEALAEAFRRLLLAHDYIPAPPPVFYGEPRPAEAPAPYPADGECGAQVPPAAPMPA